MRSGFAPGSTSEPPDGHSTMLPKGSKQELAKRTAGLLNLARKRSFLTMGARMDDRRAEPGPSVTRYPMHKTPCTFAALTVRDPGVSVQRSPTETHPAQHPQQIYFRPLEDPASDATAKSSAVASATAAFTSASASALGGSEELGGVREGRNALGFRVNPAPVKAPAEERPAAPPRAAPAPANGLRRRSNRKPVRRAQVPPKHIVRHRPQSTVTFQNYHITMATHTIVGLWASPLPTSRSSSIATLTAGAASMGCRLRRRGLTVRRALWIPA